MNTAYNNASRHGNLQVQLSENLIVEQRLSPTFTAAVSSCVIVTVQGLFQLYRHLFCSQPQPTGERNTWQAYRFQGKALCAPATHPQSRLGRLLQRKHLPSVCLVVPRHRLQTAQGAHFAKGKTTTEIKREGEGQSAAQRTSCFRGGRICQSSNRVAWVSLYAPYPKLLPRPYLTPQQTTAPYTPHPQQHSTVRPAPGLPRHPPRRPGPLIC